ncbi:putative methyltransferase [Oscillibacter valericigenes Sjm18-20]|nr:putative methyltransferase [Oscillibacter valericigenes Sjm18-20]
MTDEWESPSFLYKVIDSLGNNHLFGFIYTNYIKTLGLSGNENILDFGSGSGAGSKHLAKLIQNKNGSLTCLDTSIYWTSVAKRRLHHYKNITFYTDLITELHLFDNSFDIIYIHYTLHDVPQAQRTGIIEEFHRIIKPSGRLCIKEPQRANDGMPVEEIEELMSEAGFIKTDSLRDKGTFSGIYHK